MNPPELSDRYDRLWTKVERLVEIYLDIQLAALEAAPLSPALAPEKSSKRSAKSRLSAAKASRKKKSTSSTSSTPFPPSIEIMRTIYVAVQSLHRTHEARFGIAEGGANALQPIGSDGPAIAAAQDLSHRVQQMFSSDSPNRDDEDSV